MNKKSLKQHKRLSNSTILDQLLLKRSKKVSNELSLFLKITLFLLKNCFYEVLNNCIDNNLQTSLQGQQECLPFLFYQQLQKAIQFKYEYSPLKQHSHLLEVSVKQQRKKIKSQNHFYVFIILNYDFESAQIYLEFKLQVDFGLIKIYQQLQKSSQKARSVFSQLLSVLIMNSSCKNTKMQPLFSSKRLTNQKLQTDLNRQGYRQLGQKKINMQCQQIIIDQIQEQDKSIDEDDVWYRIQQMNKAFKNSDFSYLLTYKQKLLDVFNHLCEHSELYHIKKEKEKQQINIQKLVKKIYQFEFFPFAEQIHKDVYEILNIKVRKFFIDKGLGWRQKKDRVQRMENVTEQKKNDKKYNDYVKELQKNRGQQYLQKMRKIESCPLDEDWKIIYHHARYHMKNQGTHQNISP